MLLHSRSSRHGPQPPKTADLAPPPPQRPQAAAAAHRKLLIEAVGGRCALFVASRNTAKVEAAREAVLASPLRPSARFLRVTPLGVASGVAEQPLEMVGTARGAHNRCESAVEEARFVSGGGGVNAFVAIENGVFCVRVPRALRSEHPHADAAGDLFVDRPVTHVRLELGGQWWRATAVGAGVVVPAEAVREARRRSPDDYECRETGLAVTCGAVLADMFGVDAGLWHEALSPSGKTRRELMRDAVRAALDEIFAALAQVEVDE